MPKKRKRPLPENRQPVTDGEASNPSDADSEPDERDASDKGLEDVPGAEFDERVLWQRAERPGSREIAEQNELLQRRQQHLRLAADYVARAFAEFAEVQKVVLFGSVALPLKKEVPRFREFRRHRIEVYHECKDVDLAVWLTSLDRLRALGRARSRAMNDLFADHEVGVAHHQVDVFLMEPGTDRYLGRLCSFGECPKGKLECLVPGCGATLFLQQHEDFRLRPTALDPKRTVVLFDRGAAPGSAQQSIEHEPE